MAHDAYVVKLKNIRKHSNADRLQCATVFGANVIVGLNANEEDLYIYFPTEVQLDEEYCAINDLVRRKDENGNQCGGYLDPVKRYIRPLKLRGEISDGLVMPLSSVAQFNNGEIPNLKEGDTATVINGHILCWKYIPLSKPVRFKGTSKDSKKKKEETVVFPQHIDTPQLQYCLNNFHPCDHIIITEKLEGTSHRSALLPVYKTNWLRKLFKLPSKKIYKDFCGSRRVTIEEGKDGYYGSNDFRMEVHNRLVPHLKPNMEVFGEIVGYLGDTPIMGSVNTKKLNDKQFTQTYGENMEFSYGCARGEYKFYVYRIVLLDDDGDVTLEYSTDQIIAWCEANGFEYVPILYRGYLGSYEWEDAEAEARREIEELASAYNDGPSTLDNRHWREGCVIRRENNARKFDVYKSKNYTYRFLKGMATDNIQNTDNISADLLEEMV